MKKDRIADKLYCYLGNSKSFLEPGESAFLACVKDLGLKDEGEILGIYQNAEPYANSKIVFYEDKIVVIDSSCLSKLAEFSYLSIKGISIPKTKQEWATNELAVAVIRLDTNESIKVPVATSNNKINGPDIGNFMTFLSSARAICKATIYNRDSTKC